MLELIAVLIQTLSKYGPDLVKTVMELIQGNPQQPGETDDAYIARINTEIDAKLKDAEDKDHEVEKS